MRLLAASHRFSMMSERHCPAGTDAARSLAGVIEDLVRGGSMDGDLQALMPPTGHCLMRAIPGTGFYLYFRIDDEDGQETVVLLTVHGLTRHFQDRWPS